MQRLALKTETINKILDGKKNVLIMPSINKDMPLLPNSNCVIQELWKVTILGNNLIIKYRSKIPDKIIKNCDTKMREKIENKKTYLYKKKFLGFIRPALLDEKLASMFLYLKEPIFKRIQDLSIDEIVSYGIKRYSNDHRIKTEFIKAWDKDMAERRRTIYCYENNPIVCIYPFIVKSPILHKKDITPKMPKVITVKDIENSYSLKEISQMHNEIFELEGFNKFIYTNKKGDILDLNGAFICSNNLINGKFHKIKKINIEDLEYGDKIIYETQKDGVSIFEHSYYLTSKGDRAIISMIKEKEPFTGLTPADHRISKEIDINRIVAII